MFPANHLIDVLSRNAYYSGQAEARKEMKMRSLCVPGTSESHIQFSSVSWFLGKKRFSLISRLRELSKIMHTPTTNTTPEALARGFKAETN